MPLSTALHFVNVFFAGILAGMEIVIHYGLRAPSATLSDRSQLQLRQALVLRLRVLVPACFVPTALSSVALAVLDEARAGLWLRGGGLFLMLVWIAIRVVGTVPINSATLTWDLESPPESWKAQVARAERFHDVGVWAAVGWFVSALLT